MSVRIMIVLKIGGDIYRKGLGTDLGNEIREIIKSRRLVIVHGGGDEVTSIAEKLGKEQVFVTSPSGIRSRYTDEETVEIYTMVMAGKINKAIVRWLLSQGVLAVGLAGLDGALLRAERKKRLIIVDERNRKRIVDGGYTGKITHVDSSVLELLSEKGYVPVVAPIALGEESEFLNVDSDRAAGEIAGALKAADVIFLTDVKGVRLDGRYVSRMSVQDAEKSLPGIGPGMDKKVLACVEALKAGAGQAVISSGLIDKPLTSALNHSSGTVITVG